MPDSPEIERLARASRTSAVVSALGLLILIGSLLFGFFRLRHVNEEVRLAEERVFDFRQDLAQLEARRDSLEAVADSLFEQLRMIDPILAQRTVRQAAEAVEEARSFRIYLHAGDDPGMQAARQAQSVLRDEGYSVPGIERLERMPSRSEIRYFHASDEPEARRIAEILTRHGIEIQLADLTGRFAPGRVPERQAEIWLAISTEPRRRL